MSRNEVEDQQNNFFILCKKLNTFLYEAHFRLQQQLRHRRRY